MGPPTLPCRAVPCHAGKGPRPPARVSLPFGGSAVLVRLLPGLKLNEEGKTLKNRGQMGQLVTATQAGLGSGLPALRRCCSAVKPIFSGELKAVGARHSANAWRGRGRCRQPSSTPSTTGRTRGGGSGLLALALAQPPGLSPGAGGQGRWDAHRCPPRDGWNRGPIRHSQGRWELFHGLWLKLCSNRLHPWQGGTEALAFPSLASLVVLIREVGAGRAALPASRSKSTAGVA